MTGIADSKQTWNICRDCFSIPKTLCGGERMKLYILGNGFDLWHDLPTSYGEFYESARDVLDEVESYFHLDLGNEASPWHDFENRLGTYNWRHLYNEHDNTDVTSEGFKPSHVYSFQDELVERADELVDLMITRKLWTPTSRTTSEASRTLN